MFPRLPLSSLTSFLSSLSPPLMSPHVLSSPLMPRLSSPLVSPHCLSSSCPLLSPRHLPVSSPLVISPCLPSRPFITSPPVSLCPLIISPTSPFTSAAVPCPQGRPPSHTGVSPAAAGKGERDPLSSRSGLAAAVAAGGRRQPGAPAQLGDLGQGGPAPAPLCPGPGTGVLPTGRQRWELGVRVPSPRPARCHRVTVPCPGCCGRRSRQWWEHPPSWEHPRRREAEQGAMPGAQRAPGSGSRAGFCGRGTCPCCPQERAGPRAGWPCRGVGQVPLGAFVFADPTRAVLPALAEEFWEGDDDRLMKPIKQ